MLTLLVVDDDEEVRAKAMRALAGPHFRLASAADGRIALEQAALLTPDIVICDVDMPEMNGFDVLAALKADPANASLQVMMLTAQVSRNAMRLGMSLGADDYLTKPFSDQELIDAVDGLIKRRGRLEVFRDSVTQGREDSTRHHESTIVLPHGGTNQGELSDAAVLYTGIHDFAALAAKLSASDVMRLLIEYFERAGEPVLSHGGQNLRLTGDHLVALFTRDARHAISPSHRAMQAAQEIAQTVPFLIGWVERHLADYHLPALGLGIGLHVGPVTIDEETGVVSGPAINAAERLKSASLELGWTIVASQTVVDVTSTPNPALHLGRSAQLVVEGMKQPLGVSEVIDVRAPAELTLFEKTISVVRKGLVDMAESTLAPTRDKLPDDAAATLRATVHAHARQIARATKDALSEKLVQLRSADPSDTSQPIQLEGFTLVRRLGAGGMSSIHLARRDADGALVVLKVVQLDPAAPDVTARFVREYALLSTLDHPHIVRIFKQGFTDNMAYIAMEYFENGDLRSRLKGPMPPQQAVRLLCQMAGALGAVHSLGIVHRDLKPENLMVRANGDVVLADFGIAKLTGIAGGDDASLTVSGELIGSPSYMSPEQIAGSEVTAQSDLYSLGVMFCEMCTGSRPFRSSSLVELLSMHNRAEVPTLPSSHAHLQPVLARLMAKTPAQRYATTHMLLEDLRAIQMQDTQA